MADESGLQHGRAGQTTRLWQGPMASGRGHTPSGEVFMQTNFQVAENMSARECDLLQLQPAP